MLIEQLKINSTLGPIVYLGSLAQGNLVREPMFLVQNHLGDSS